jgi:hypothetical protein
MISMRPLIEILEDERAAIQKLESLYRYLSKHDDPEVLDILMSKKKQVENEITDVRNEIVEYLTETLR